MTERSENGRFTKGNKGGPGRPKRTDEERYNAVLLSVISPERFQYMLELQARKADRGDSDAFKYICKLLGMEVNRNELTGLNGGPIVISWDED